jgi:hypothetical protein
MYYMCMHIRRDLNQMICDGNIQLACSSGLGLCWMLRWITMQMVICFRSADCCWHWGSIAPRAIMLSGKPPVASILGHGNFRRGGNEDRTIR